MFLLWALAAVTPDHSEVYPTTQNPWALPTRNCLQSYLLSWEILQVLTWNCIWGPQASELLLSWPLASVPCLGVVTRVGLGEGGGWKLPLISLMVGLITDRVCGWVVWGTLGWGSGPCPPAKACGPGWGHKNTVLTLFSEPRQASCHHSGLEAGGKPRSRERVP